MTGPGPHIHPKQLGGKLRVRDSQNSTLSLIAGCQRVKTWTRELYSCYKAGSGIDGYLGLDMKCSKDSEKEGTPQDLNLQFLTVCLFLGLFFVHPFLCSMNI